MCGIIGIVSNECVVDGIFDALKRLEYRGYDSAGIAVLQNGEIIRRRAEGKLKELGREISQNAITGHIGIGHTRWATHGQPTTTNAHPHGTEKVVVVHNGIIENFKSLKTSLENKGYTFHTQTDTEVVPILITSYLDEGKSPKEAVSLSIKELEGAFALGIIFRDEKDKLFLARKGSPLAIGYGDGEMFLGSDAVALAPFTRKIAYLEEGDWGEITQNGATLYDENNNEVEREITISNYDNATIGKGNYRHFMLKEIYEQPTVLGEAINAYYNPISQEIELPELPFDIESLSKITLVACGTAYYAALTAKYWIEQIARIPVEVDIASEYRYRKPVFSTNSPLPLREGVRGRGEEESLPPTPALPLKGGGSYSSDELVVVVSQSGETADTLAALRYAKQQGVHTLAVVNVAESSMAVEADGILRILAGVEIGVASTKAFTAQLTVLLCLALYAGVKRGNISKEEVQKYTFALSQMPSLITEVLNQAENIERIAHSLENAKSILYLGRGMSYPIALEGALKLKELSYIHTEGYPAGELKHGPIALIDENMPVVVIAPYDELFEKTMSNAYEVAARGGQLIIITDKRGAEKVGDLAKDVLIIPETESVISPIIYAIPVQLLAYYVAVHKGTDVDQPRNLAKSVTVE